jgi:hypothetical protein
MAEGTSVLPINKGQYENLADRERRRDAMEAGRPREPDGFRVRGRSYALVECRPGPHISPLCPGVASYPYGDDGNFRRVPDRRNRHVGRFRRYLRPNRPPRGDVVRSQRFIGRRIAFRRRARRLVGFRVRAKKMVNAAAVSVTMTAQAVGFAAGLLVGASRLDGCRTPQSPRSKDLPIDRLRRP